MLYYARYVCMRNFPLDGALGLQDQTNFSRIESEKVCKRRTENMLRTSFALQTVETSKRAFDDDVVDDDDNDDHDVNVPSSSYARASICLHVFLLTWTGGMDSRLDRPSDRMSVHREYRLVPISVHS